MVPTFWNRWKAGFGREVIAGWLQQLPEIASRSYLRQLHPDIDNYADLAAAVLPALGIPGDRIVSIPAPSVDRDRTYAGGLELGRWIESMGDVHTIDVLTDGAHGRRSWLIYSLAIGNTARIGILSLPSGYYDPDQWWATSYGVRTVVGEALAYVYVKLLFFP